jgi:hypothetical protein
MPVLLNGDGKKNDVATVAKYWWACRVGLGAQAGLPVLLNGNDGGTKGDGEH